MARIYNPEDAMIGLLEAAQSESVMERNHHSRDRGAICEELGDATDLEFIAFHDYDASYLEGLLQKGLHLKPTSQPKKTSLD